MNFSLFFSLNTFQTISTLTAVIFLSFSTIRSQISSLKLYAILVSLFFSKISANDRGYAHPAVCGRIHCRTTQKLKRVNILLIARIRLLSLRRVLN